MSEIMSAEQVAEIKVYLAATIERLQSENINTISIAQFVPARRRFLFTKKARFEAITKAWPLGVLLLSTDGNLFATGETTRAIPPGYPGHTSAERERRREYNKVAFNSGFEVGAIIYFDCKHLPVESVNNTEDLLPLIFEPEGTKVLWAKTSKTANAIDFKKYVNEQVELSIEKQARNS